MQNISFLELALLSDDGQQWTKHVKALLNIKLLHLIDLGTR
jgi:hypothetical protein